MKKLHLLGAAYAGTLFFVCSVFVLLTPLAYADSVNVSASSWGVARDTGRDGTFDTLETTASIFLEIIPNANFVSRGIWEFDLSNFPSGTILGVNLQIAVISTTLEQASVDLYGYTGNGTIEVADADAGTLMAVVPGDLSQQSFDVTSFILDSSVQAAGFAGFNVRFSDETAGVRQKSLEDPSFNFGNGKPWLVVDFTPVPIPAAAWLFGSGLLGLIGVSRCKKAA